MAILIEPYKAIYVVIPKVCATSFKTMLAEHLDIDLAGRSPHRVPFPHPRGRWPLLRRIRYARYFKFGFVRNPWDRLVSCYKDKIRDQSSGDDTWFTIRPGVADCLAGHEGFVAGMSFDDFVDVVASIPDEEANAHIRSQHTFFDPRVGFPADFIGRMERLPEDWHVIRERMGFPEVDPPRRKATPSSDYQSFYTPRARDVAGRRFARDIELFDYEF